MILTKSSSELSVISHSPCHSSDTNKEQGSTQLAQHGVASALFPLTTSTSEVLI